MYIRLQNTLINLDLVKEVDDVTAHAFTYKNKIGREKTWMHYDEMTSEEEAEYLTRSATEEGFEYVVMYCIKVWYLDADYPKYVRLGHVRSDAQKLFNEFATLLNNNNPNIPHLKIEI